MKRKLIISMLMCLVPWTVHASSAVWPTQPITIIVPYSPGGLTDQIARTLSLEIEKETQQSVLIKYMPGGTNLVALNHAARMENNDHTFVLTMDDFILGPMNQDSTIYRKFNGVYVTSFLPFVVVTKDPSKAQITKNQTKINLAVVGTNSAADLWAKSLSGISVNSVAYKGAAPAITDLLGGHIDYGVFSIGVIKTYIDDGKLHPVMVSSARRSNKLPKTPTATELGFRGTDSITWFAFIARDDTSETALKGFSSMLQRIHVSKAPLKFLSERGAEVVNWDLDRSRRFVEDQKKNFESQK